MREGRAIGAEAIERLAEELGPLGAPVIVFNKSHSGSRLLVDGLKSCGLFMGSNLNDSGDALDLLPVVRHSTTSYYPDFSRLFEFGDPTLFRGIARAVQSHLEARSGQSAWGWKLSETGYALPLFARVFPAAKFIHLIRDGRDVAFSPFVSASSPFMRKAHFGSLETTSLSGVPASDAGYDLAPHLFNARLWVEAVTSGRHYGSMLGSRYREVRYEDLVLNPAVELGRIAEWAGLRPSSDTLAEFAASTSIAAVGKHQRAPSAELVEALSILEPTLTTFGYGRTEAVAAHAYTPLLSVILLGDDAEGAGITRNRGAMAIFPDGTAELIDAAAQSYSKHTDPAYQAEPDLARVRDGIARARGRYVLFLPAGSTVHGHNIAQLLHTMVQENAAAAFATARGEDGTISLAMPDPEDVRWADALPIGAAILDRVTAAAGLAALSADPVRPVASWHLTLVQRAALSGRTLARRTVISTGTCLPTRRFAPFPGSASEEPGTALPQIVVVGKPDASFSLLFDGLPACHKRHIRLMVPVGTRAFAQELMGATAVIFLRDFDAPMESGVITLLQEMGIPYWYMTDDNYLALRHEYPQLAYYTEENHERFLSGAAGVIAATPALRDAFQAFHDDRRLWPHVFDASLLPEPAYLPLQPPFRRIGVFGGLFRSEAFKSDISPALGELGLTQPVTLISRAGMVDRVPPFLKLVETNYMNSFRQFVFRWRNLCVDTVIHPPGRTINAPYKSRTALLTSCYLGAIPLVMEHEIYGGLGHDQGVLAPADVATLADTLRSVGDPKVHAAFYAALRTYCELNFQAAPAMAIIDHILAQAAHPDRAELDSRIAWVDRGWVSRPTR